MTPPAIPAVMYVGNDPSLEYLLGRYAQRSGCRIESVRGKAFDLSADGPRPVSVWFSSLEVLEASPALRAAAAGLDIPLVVCASVVDDARALELGADYIFLHPVTYDFFVSTLGQANPPLGDEAARKEAPYRASDASTLMTRPDDHFGASSKEDKQ